MSEYHRVYAKISLDAIEKNLDNIKKRTGKGVLVMPVIKADGYGHGAVEIAKKIESKSDAFAVAVIEEALELRQNGIKVPILILGTLSAMDFESAINNDISVTVYTEDMAYNLSCVAKKCKRNAKIHLALNTGMNRIGINCDNFGIEIAKKIASFSDIEIKGIFSHFATADETDKTQAKLQLERFTDFCDKLEKSGVSLGAKHICNSAGITDIPECFLDMVRPGIILYGLNPSDETLKSTVELTPALELKSHISFIKKVQQSEGISYGRTYIAKSERVIATIPVGYADGYPRKLSNKGRVIIHGKYAPITGRVCMDQFMVDITDIPEAKEEDSVTLIGTDGKCAVTADEIAKIADTINYEIVCGISKRVIRVYK